MESVIDQACAAALYAEGDAALDTGASLLAAAPDADDALHRRGEEFVTRAWGGAGSPPTWSGSSGWSWTSGGRCWRPR